MDDRVAADQAARSTVEEAISEPSYRFRASLTAIVGFAELLQTRDSEHVRREAPRHIQEAAEALLRELDREPAGVREPAPPPRPSTG